MKVFINRATMRNKNVAKPVAATPDVATPAAATPDAAMQPLVAGAEKSSPELKRTPRRGRDLLRAAGRAAAIALICLVATANAYAQTVNWAGMTTYESTDGIYFSNFREGQCFSHNLDWKKISGQTINGVINLTGAGVVIIEVTAGKTATINAVITGSGVGIQKVGAGTLILNGANTYTGRTIISNGTLKLGASGSIAQSEKVEFCCNITYDHGGSINNNIGGNDYGKYEYGKNGVFDISAGDKTIKRLGTYVSPSSVATHKDAVVALGGSTLTIGTSGQSDGDGDYRGRFTGTGNVYKRGTGTLQLYAKSSSPTGLLHLQGGTLTMHPRNGVHDWGGRFAMDAGTTLNIEPYFNNGVKILGRGTIQGGTINISGTVYDNASLIPLEFGDDLIVQIAKPTINITSDWGNILSGYKSKLLIKYKNATHRYTEADFNINDANTSTSGVDIRLWESYENGSMLNISPRYPEFTSTTIGTFNPRVGVSFSEDIPVTPVINTPTFSVLSGTLPPGLSLSAPAADPISAVGYWERPPQREHTPLRLSWQSLVATYSPSVHLPLPWIKDPAHRSTRGRLRATP